MTMKRLIFFGILLFLSFFFTGCQKSEERGLGEKELVRINDISISLGEFQQMLEKQPLEGKMKLLSEKGTRDFLENYVIPREVLYQEAKKKGLDKNKEILAKIDEVVFRPIPDDATRIAELKVGNVDIISNLKPDNIKEIEAEKQLTVKYAPSARTAMIFINAEIDKMRQEAKAYEESDRKAKERN
jgi:hypothetical protein